MCVGIFRWSDPEKHSYASLFAIIRLCGSHLYANFSLFFSLSSRRTRVPPRTYEYSARVFLDARLLSSPNFRVISKLGRDARRAFTAVVVTLISCIDRVIRFVPHNTLGTYVPNIAARFLVARVCTSHYLIKGCRVTEKFELTRVKE